MLDLAILLFTDTDEYEDHFNSLELFVNFLFTGEGTVNKRRML